MPGRKAPPEPRHRILIVDDEESTRLLLARLLARGMRVEPQLAGTGEQALRLARNFAYDAILLDLMMPGIGGFELLRAVRRSPVNKATPVLVVSVLSDRASIERARAAGANDYLTKPVAQDVLVRAVKALLAARDGSATG